MTSEYAHFNFRNSKVYFTTLHIFVTGRSIFCKLCPLVPRHSNFPGQICISLTCAELVSPITKNPSLLCLCVNLSPPELFASTHSKSLTRTKLRIPGSTRIAIITTWSGNCFTISISKFLASKSVLQNATNSFPTGERPASSVVVALNYNVRYRSLHLFHIPYSILQRVVSSTSVSFPFISNVLNHDDIFDVFYEFFTSATFLNSTNVVPVLGPVPIQSLQYCAAICHLYTFYPTYDIQNRSPGTPHALYNQLQCIKTTRPTQCGLCPFYILKVRGVHFRSRSGF